MNSDDELIVHSPQSSALGTHCGTESIRISNQDATHDTVMNNANKIDKNQQQTDKNGQRSLSGNIEV